MAVSIIIPAHNEELTIGQVIDQLREVMEAQGLPYEIIVVDDGSSDRTAEMVKSKRVKMLRSEQRRGYGAALKRGIKEAQFDTVLITDADATYPVKEVPRLIQEMENYHMAVGARTGSHVEMPLLRRIAKGFLTLLANYLTSSKIPDLNSGLRAMKREPLLRFLSILPDGFSFTTTITLAMMTNDYSIKYVPIDYHKRSGKSKIKPIQDTLNFLGLIIRTVMYFNPLKVFLPLSGILFLMGMGILFYSLFFTPQIMDITVLTLLSLSIQVAVMGFLADLIDKRSSL